VGKANKNGKTRNRLKDMRDDEMSDRTGNLLQIAKKPKWILVMNLTDI
jgi:hypothetical protein